MDIPDENASAELTYFKDVITQFLEPYGDDERFIEFKAGIETKFGSFMATYERETLLFVMGKPVNRESLMNEKARALAFVID